MKTSYDVIDPRSGHLAALNLYRDAIKPATRQGGCGRLTWEDANPTTRAGMRKAFHGYVLKAFVDQTGYSQKEMKDILTWQFCPDQFDDDGELVGEFEKSTEAMTDSQFAQFLIDVEVWGARELGLLFPPRPVTTEQES